MTISESYERTLPLLSPYIKCPIKMCVIVFQIDMFLLILEPNNQLNVCTTSVTEGEVAGVKLV